MHGNKNAPLDYFISSAYLLLSQGNGFGGGGNELNFHLITR